MKTHVRQCGSGHRGYFCAGDIAFRRMNGLGIMNIVGDGHHTWKGATADEMYDLEIAALSVGREVGKIVKTDEDVSACLVPRASGWVPLVQPKDWHMQVLAETVPELCEVIRQLPRIPQRGDA